MSIFRDFRSSARRHGAPVTVALVVAMIAGFLAIWMNVVPTLFDALVFDTAKVADRPWTILTYPYVAAAGGFVGLLFLCLWMWSIGGSVERELGNVTYLVVWLAFTVLCALGLWVGSAILGLPGVLVSGWSPVAALSVIWGTRNAVAPVTLMFVLPVTGRWIAWLAAGLLFFGTYPPQLAPFAAAPLFFAYLYAANKIAFLPYGQGPTLGMRSSRGENAAGSRRVYKQEYYDEVKRREQAREERERLRKLFEQSAKDDSQKEDS